MRPFKILSQGCLTSTLFLSIMIKNQRLMKLFPAFLLLGLIGAPAMAHGNHHSSHKHNHCHKHSGRVHHCHKHGGNHHGRYHYHDGIMTYHDGHYYQKQHNHKPHKHHKNHRNHYFVVPWLHIDIN